MWPFGSSPSEPEPTPVRKATAHLRKLESGFIDAETRADLEDLLAQAIANPYVASAVAVTLVGSGTVFYRRYLRRITNASFLTPSHLERPGRIKGMCTRVGDADGIRVYHTPGPGWGWLRHVPTERNELKDETLAIRIAGVDAPEMAHFGKPSQPYADVAHRYLTERCLGKTVKLKLLSKDRYGRVVAMVYARPSPLWPVMTNVSYDMLKKGLAIVYASAGAEYDGMEKKFLKAEAKAKRWRVGMWSQKHFESPREYKKRHGITD
ncbi:uncharacterized protein L969DRAFT_43297 [Mixia osmundae IAM 14324]|uniref:TNase-like domain-containing protein n=1 Tax=Mixia osmundae (strain CBS 9802 / IAM 14324 / JCM 22182 / KY 12970) TaxID=764103 RepID=G7DTP3_MIXOS|nr:uncharacterized protein L969DRAFT_43297 [Mixia osmundae IAM 14324]KEI42776.1 hypothetical protein L969DRAFT_43297 [Mixia osmundae IAM 14324]GAA93890.1 hypothetical protein E5Q_00536 [Mixia osmundae IAM 14324]